MPTYRAGTTCPPLPQRTLDYLGNGAPEGSRNAELFDAACQLRDAGLERAEADGKLIARALADGLSEGEARRTIESAFAKERRGPAAGSGRRAEGNQSPPKAVPEPIPDGFLRLLDACFLPEEFVAVAPATENDLGEIVPTKGVTLKREQWKERAQNKGGIERCFSTKLGVFIRINPMREGGSKNEDVTALRHVLVEFDREANGATVPKDEQLRLIRQSGLPVSALIDSGNKSLHAWVRVDAKDADEYRQRVERVWELFDGKALDRQNRNPSRLSRCPGGRRTVDGEVRVQQLLAIGIGATSWNEWAGSIADKTPEPIPLATLGSYDIENDPNNVLGRRWLCRGSSLVIIGQSGTGKSSLCMQLIVAWGLGVSAFGIAPQRPLRSLIIQAENDVGDLAEMYQGVRAGMKLTAEQERDLAGRIFLYRDTTHAGLTFIDFARRLVEKHRPDLVWADPLLNYIGDDISQQRVVSDFSRQLNIISEETGVIWCMMHHTGKPPKEPREHWTPSDLAYMGLGSSTVTNWSRETALLMRVKAPDGTPQTFQFSMTKRRIRAGLRTMDGIPTDTIFLQHAAGGGILWEQCEPPAPPAPKQPTGRYKIAGRPSGFDEKTFREVLSSHGGTLSRENAESIAATMNVGTRTVWRWWKKLNSSVSGPAREGDALIAASE